MILKIICFYLLFQHLHLQLRKILCVTLKNKLGNRECQDYGRLFIMEESQVLCLGMFSNQETILPPLSIRSYMDQILTSKHYLHYCVYHTCTYYHKFHCAGMFKTFFNFQHSQCKFIVFVCHFRYSTLPPAVQWGLDHETSAKADYLVIKKSLDETTQVFETGLTLYPTHSFLGATSDGRVVENEGSSEGLLEIKCPYSIKGQNISHYEIPDIISMNDKNFCLEMLTTEPTLKKTHKYYAQVQGEMAIKGLPWVDFVVWTAAASNNIFVERVLFDVQYVSAMMPKLVNFYMEKIYPLLYTDQVFVYV